MPSFSFDIVSDYDKAEMNNVFAAVEREIASRYDFKGTSAAIEWMNGKSGFKVTGAGEWQCDMIIDIIRKKLSTRGQSSKTLDLSKPIVEANLKTTRDIPFKQGLTQENAKKITKQLQSEAFKIKTQIQGDAVRVTSASKDELQKVIALLNDTDYDFPLQFINYR